MLIQASHRLHGEESKKRYVSDQGASISNKRYTREKGWYAGERGSEWWNRPKPAMALAPEPATALAPEPATAVAYDSPSDQGASISNKRCAREKGWYAGERGSEWWNRPKPAIALAPEPATSVAYDSPSDQGASISNNTYARENGWYAGERGSAWCNRPKSAIALAPDPLITYTFERDLLVEPLFATDRPLWPISSSLQDRTQEMKLVDEPYLLLDELMSLSESKPVGLLALDLNYKYLSIAVSTINRQEPVEAKHEPPEAKHLGFLLNDSSSISSIAQRLAEWVSEFSVGGVVIGICSHICTVLVSKKLIFEKSLQVKSFVQDLSRTGKLNDVKYTYGDNAEPYNMVEGQIMSRCLPLCTKLMLRENSGKDIAVLILQDYLRSVDWEDGPQWPRDGTTSN